MALSLGGGGGVGGRRRWACRAARRGARGGAAGCRHFHVHVHVHLPRQVRDFPSLRRVLLWPSCLLILPPVLLLAALAFLVCFGWLTLAFLVSSLLSRADDRELLVSSGGGGGGGGGAGDSRAGGDAGEPCGGGEEAGEERLVARVAAESAGDSSAQEFGRQEIEEVLGGGLPEESSWSVSRMASPSPRILVSCDEHPDDEKVVKEVAVFETNRRDSGASEDLSRSPEKHDQVLDIAVDSFLVDHDIKGFSQIRWTEKLLDVQPYGEEFFMNRKEISEFVDKHETGAVVGNGGARLDVNVVEVESSDDSVHGAPGDEHSTEINQEQSMTGLPDDSVANKLPGDVAFDEWEETLVIGEHKNKLAAEDVCTKEDGVQTVGISDETTSDSVCEMSGLPLDSACEDESKSEPESVATSNDSFHQEASSDQDDRHEGDLTENKRTDSSSSASAIGDSVADNHWRKIEELGRSGNDDNSNGEGALKNSVVERAGDEDEDADDTFTSVGAPRRLPLVRRSPAPWWHLCGVLDVLAGGED